MKIGIKTEDNEIILSLEELDFECKVRDEFILRVGDGGVSAKEVCHVKTELS